LVGTAYNPFAHKHFARDVVSGEDPSGHSKHRGLPGTGATKLMEHGVQALFPSIDVSPTSQRTQELLFLVGCTVPAGHCKHDEAPVVFK